MSRPVHERLRQLEAEVQHLPVLPAAAIRARGGRRRRRRATGVLVGTAMVATAAGLTAPSALDRLSPDRTAAAGPAASCVLTPPPDPAAVRVRVRNGGADARLGDLTSAGLRERGFTVLTDSGAGNPSPGPTTLYYGPAAIGAATLLRAVLIGDAAMRFDPGRTDDAVDLALGTTAVRLATSTEVNQALLAAGPPSAPPEC
ncbi:LytR C-terminal domain-containing protein [Jidongwangia harbinensis]|uniref:LytR C-terminal domain-containing protein n=1 Tax=Jidongwangia harbinensis TaxID=2878561 RepID=UPI001CDA0916|nr:LytR C-terminal domain-containing protein [Jidongwangia harbinensis]MCA2215724.1 LytR C-terminal domain-containing protein [Jidongwangia harbinensis]